MEQLNRETTKDLVFLSNIQRNRRILAVALAEMNHQIETNPKAFQERYGTSFTEILNEVNGN